MNFNGFDFNAAEKTALASLESNEKIPHAVIIECDNSEKLLEYAKFLSMYLVCISSDRPCGKCNQCKKAFDKAHADISYPKPVNKSNTYSIDQIKSIIKDSYIIPNEANAKVYVFENADNGLSVVAQNALLKTLEEPPKNVYFILLCSSAQKLLTTIRSRCSSIRIDSERAVDENMLENARSIVGGIISSREYDLLKALNTLENKDFSDEILSCVTLILRDGLKTLVYSKPETDSELAKNTAARLTKGQIIELIEITNQARIKIKQNISIHLLTTWLCGEYRRISWQR